MTADLHLSPVRVSLRELYEAAYQDGAAYGAGRGVVAALLAVAGLGLVALWWGRRG